MTELQNTNSRLQSQLRSKDLELDRERARRRQISNGWRKDVKGWKECKAALLNDMRDMEKRRVIIEKFDEDCEYEKEKKRAEIARARERVYKARQLKREEVEGVKMEGSVPETPVKGKISVTDADEDVEDELPSEFFTFALS